MAAKSDKSTSAPAKKAAALKSAAKTSAVKKPAAAKKPATPNAPVANPFLDDSVWMPNYDQMTPELCDAAFEATVEKAERAFAMAEKCLEVSWKGLVLAPMEALRAPFTVWGHLSHITSVINDDNWRAVEAKWQPAIIRLSQIGSQSKIIYEGLLALRATDTLEPWQQHVVDRELEGMKTSGVGLKGAERTRFNHIQTELAKLSMKFSNNVQDADREAKIEVQPDEAEGIPADLVSGDGPWTLGIDFATYDAVMKYAKSSSLRERFWRARVTRASSGKGDNTPLIKKILELRQQMADLLGAPDYAHLSTAGKMAGTPDTVFALLDPMVTVGRPAAKAENEELRKFASANGFRGRLRPWDRAYWAEKMAQDRFAFDEEALRAYFPIERVVSGLFALIHDLFGVSFVQRTDDIHAWHKDVRFYEVRNDKDELVAGFYFDPYARPGIKSSGAWMNGLRERDFETRECLPIAVICCNQKNPKPGEPATMSFYEVTTLFHEMGHALQMMLTRVSSVTCSGINNVEWDAVEIASQFLEQFPYNPTVLKSLSAHIETGKPLTPDMMRRIIAKRTYLAGNALVRQLLFAMTDLTIHGKAFPKRYKDANACKQRFSKKLLPSPMHEDDRFLNAFTHIFSGGYAAGYYSYKWSETLSADIYVTFDNLTAKKRQTFARRYMDTFLALGGSEPAADVFRKLMGRDPDPSAILKMEGLLDDTAAATLFPAK